MYKPFFTSSKATSFLNILNRSCPLKVKTYNPKISTPISTKSTMDVFLPLLNASIRP